MKFERYVSCNRCHTIYYYKDCLEGSGSNQRSKHCNHSPFGRQRCGNLLLKSVELSSGKRLLYPFLTYCFVGIKLPLQSLLRQGFVESCSEWKSRLVSENALMDVYDGRMWKEFQHIEGQSFLLEPYSFGVMLNVDWFQPYKHLSYSVGVIFVTFMNLPRAL